MKALNTILIAIGLVLFLSCGQQPLYEKVVSFEGRKWEQGVKPEYSVDIVDINTPYDFTLTLRTTTDYKYNNLWVFMKTISPDGSSAREPFEIRITNPDGSWIGTKTGTVVETPLNFNKRKLPLQGQYQFIIEQGITESVVDEVLDIGFRVERSLID